MRTGVILAFYYPVTRTATPADNLPRPRSPPSAHMPVLRSQERVRLPSSPHVSPGGGGHRHATAPAQTRNSSSSADWSCAVTVRVALLSCGMAAWMYPDMTCSFTR